MFSQQIQIYHKSYENNYKQKQLLYSLNVNTTVQC